MTSYLDFLKEGVDYKYHSGVCYSKTWFKNQLHAEAYAKEVWDSGRTVNGGWFDGMRLGVVHPYEWTESHTKDPTWIGPVWEVMD